MKVMCIKSFKTSARFQDIPEPQVGDIDTVLFEKMCLGNKYYSLERFGDEVGYAVENFAILPDISEGVATEHEQEAIIYQR